MKVVVAIDSFKGSLTSIEAGMAAKEGILKAHPDANVVVKPLADGGEGTTDALIAGLGGERIDLTVTGPLGTPVNAHYGYLAEKKYCHPRNGCRCRNYPGKRIRKKSTYCNHLRCR